MGKNLGGLILVLLVASLRASAWAQGLPLGNEFQVNTYTTGIQEYPAVATDPSGNFVVVWMSDGQDGSHWGVFGQRFASSGTPLGTEFQVNTYTTGFQGTYPSSNIATDGAGNFVVVWTSDGQDGDDYGVFGQRFSNTGARVGTEFQVNTYTTGRQNSPTVASTVAGNFVVLWQSRSQDGSGFGVFGQRFSNTGAPLGSEFQVNTYTTGDQHAPAIALDAAGNFVVVWHSVQDGNGYGVFGQRFDSSGTPAGTEFQVNTYTTGFQAYPAIASDAAGNFVVVWTGCNNQDGNKCGVFGQRFDSSGGARVGTEFQVNTYTAGHQNGSAIAMDAAGNFVVAWQSEANQDGSSYGVFGQRFSSSGARLGSEFQVNTYTTGHQGSYPQAVAVSPNNFVVVWNDRSGEDGSGVGIFAQRFSPLVPPSPAAEHVAPALSPAALILLALGLVSLGSAVVVRRRRRA